MDSRRELIRADVRTVRSCEEQPTEWFGWKSWALELADHVEQLLDEADEN